MVKKVKLLKDVKGVPAGTVGIVYGTARSTGGLTLRFDRVGHETEVLTNVEPKLTVEIPELTALSCEYCDGSGIDDEALPCDVCDGEGEVYV
jgi:predicted oxidoreductase